MYRTVFSFIFLVSLFSTAFGQSVKIRGYAPAYVGKSVEIYAIEDYFSMKEQLIASTTVEEDSTFFLSFFSDKTQKLILKSANNRTQLYVQPAAKYAVFLPEKDKYDPFRPTGNQVELSFYDLDSTDINYKILGFQLWVDEFIGMYYHLKTYDNTTFVSELDRFKTNVEKAYKSDTSVFFKTYVRFSVAQLDNIPNAGERNKYEKHDFYIKYTPVQYENDAYMEYLKGFYQELIPRLSDRTNEEVYQGVLKSSPSAIMNALSSEYTLINVRIREMIMIKSLSEAFYSDRFPQTNIVEILDSVIQHPLFKANGIIAKNLKDRITELTPGVKAPDFVLMAEEMDTKTLFDYKDKYLYLHFADAGSLNTLEELDLLKSIHGRYGDYITFVTIYKPSDKEEGVQALQQLPWTVYEIPEGNSIWKKYRIENYPTYTLIDVTGNIVASPALGPKPNGQYETIDKIFFYIKKSIDEDRN